MYLIYYNMDQIHQLFNEPEKWIFTDILDGRKYYVWSNICDDDVLGMTLTTLWMDFTLLLLLWTSLLFTSPRISWPCLTSRYVFWDTCFNLSINYIMTLAELIGINIQYIFIVFILGSSHSWCLGRKRTGKIFPSWACLC
jgi:hypothetical protein